MKPGKKLLLVGGQVLGRGARRTQVDDELHDLEDGDVLLPPDADAAGALEVVPVHDYVHGEVEVDNYPGNGSVADQLGVA